MKSTDIINALNGVDPDMIEDAEKIDGQKSSQTRLKWGAVAACFSLVLIVLVMAFIPVLREFGNRNDGFGKNLNNGNYWIDTRERNDKSCLGQEGARVWPWNCRAIYNQYTSLSYNGAEYRSRCSSRGEDTPSDKIGKQLAVTTCKGFDDYTNQTYSIKCGIYEIVGVDSNRIIAVQYSGCEAYYPFIKDGYDAPPTLGDLVNLLALTENIAFNSFYYHPNVQSSEYYGLSREGSAELWQIISKYASAECLERYENAWNRTQVSFPLDSATLGVHNLSLAVNQEGYLITNIENYGYYYHIGIDAVREIVTYVLDHKTEPPMKQTQYLVGVVTEIGDDYIKVDDSIVMKHPAEGIEFTVYAEHMNIKRYIISGYLRVGQQVVIEHGSLSKDSYTEIRNAVDLQEAIITDSGEILIPE